MTITPAPMATHHAAQIEGEVHRLAQGVRIPACQHLQRFPRLAQGLNDEKTQYRRHLTWLPWQLNGVTQRTAQKYGDAKDYSHHSYFGPTPR